MSKAFKLSDKEVDYILGNLMAEYSVLKNIADKNDGNVIGINTLSKEEKDRLNFLKTLLNKIQQV